jgi:dCMP deaminase
MRNYIPRGEHQKDRIRLQKLLGHAKLEAESGTCNRLQVGAVIARNFRIISTGYNGAAQGQPHCDEMCYPDGPPCKNAVHAEANAVAFAARYGYATDGAIIVSTDSPCLDCARLVINAGIKGVYYTREYRDLRPLKELQAAGVYTFHI